MCTHVCTPACTHAYMHVYAHAYAHVDTHVTGPAAEICLGMEIILGMPGIVVLVAPYR